MNILNGNPPYTLSYLDLPSIIDVFNNSITVNKPKSVQAFVIGLYITDSSNITNYFDLIINVEDSLSSLKRII